MKLRLWSQMRFARAQVDPEREYDRMHVCEAVIVAIKLFQTNERPVLGTPYPIGPSAEHLPATGASIACFALPTTTVATSSIL